MPFLRCATWLPRAEYVCVPSCQPGDLNQRILASKDVILKADARYGEEYLAKGVRVHRLPSAAFRDRPHHRSPAAVRRGPLMPHKHHKPLVTTKGEPGRVTLLTENDWLSPAVAGLVMTATPSMPSSDARWVKATPSSHGQGERGFYEFPVAAVRSPVKSSAVAGRAKGKRGLVHGKPRYSPARVRSAWLPFRLPSSLGHPLFRNHPGAKQAPLSLRSNRRAATVPLLPLSRKIDT